MNQLQLQRREENARKHNARDSYHLLENGYIHTSWLTKEEAEEMLERHNRFFGDRNEYSIMFAQSL